MKAYSATFENGFVATSTRNVVVTHAWHACGTTKLGKRWSLYGFSTKSTEHAAKNLASATDHIPRQGGNIEFAAVKPVIATDHDVPPPKRRRRIYPNVLREVAPA